MNLGELRGLVRTYINEPFAAFWTDAELNRLINVGARKYHAKIKNLSRNHFTTRVTFETSADQEYYQLPANCKDLRLVSIVESDGSEPFLDKGYWPNPDRNTEAGLLSSTLGARARPQQYWLVGQSIRILPIPGSVMTLRLYYEARQVELASDSDTSPFEADYHDLAAKWAAIEASAKNKDRREELFALIGIRETELIQDLYHRVNPPVMEAEGYLEGIY